MTRSDLQARQAEAFRALHARPGAFIIPNPWDAGTARLLAMAGFEALATTSAGYAFSKGSPTTRSTATRCSITSPRSSPRAACPSARIWRTASATRPTRWPKRSGSRPRPARWAARSRRDGPRRCADLCPRSGDRAYRGGRRRGTRAAVSVHADGALRKLPAWPPRPRRHDRAARRLSRCGRRRAVRARHHRCERHRGGDAGGRRARERRDGAAGRLAEPRRAGGARREARERRRRAGTAALGAFLRAAKEMAQDGTFTFTQAAVPGRDINRWFASPDNSPVLFGE